MFGNNAGENADGALNGMVLISSTEAHVLFDTSSSHSFISFWFAYILGFQFESLARPLYLSVPLGMRMLLIELITCVTFQLIIKG